MAFNDGLLDHYEPVDVHAALDTLETAVNASDLDLDSPREDWKSLVVNSLANGAPREAAP